jgi:2-methylcitrate dehydratase PrpD
MAAPIALDTQRPVGHARRMVAFLHELDLATLPGPTEKARWCLLDALGCALLGAQQPWGQIISAEVLSDGSQGVSRILGRSEKVAPSQAALCNGTAMHGFELDDLLSEAVIHQNTVYLTGQVADDGCGPAGPASRMPRRRGLMRMSSSGVSSPTSSVP